MNKKDKTTRKIKNLLTFPARGLELLFLVVLIIASLIVVKGGTTDFGLTGSPQFDSPPPTPGVFLIKQTPTPRPTPVLDLTFSTFTMMAEVGQVSDITDTPQRIFFSHNYVNPVVLAQPVSYNESNTAVVRITNIQPDSFTLYIQEAPNKDGVHPAETVSYLVLEAGQWELSNGTRVEAGRVDTAATVGNRISNQWQAVSFDTPFPTTPVVISQVQGENDPHWVKTRQRNITTTGFDVAMEEEESKTTAHGPETVGWLSIEPGQGVWNGHIYKFGQTANAVTHSWYSVTFGQGFTQSPHIIAAIGTYDGGDSAHLRYTGLSATSVQVRVEEDTTQDAETSHTTEAVHYLAIEGDGPLTASPQ
jgi:serralysin